MRRTAKEQCDTMWANIIKLRAGWKSELSGAEGKQIGGEKVLNAHHIIGKKNFALRYSLDNGISLTNGEHKWIAHGGQAYRIYEIVGEERMKRLYELAKETTKARYPHKLEELTKIYEEMCQEKQYKPLKRKLDKYEKRKSKNIQAQNHGKKVYPDSEESD